MNMDGEGRRGPFIPSSKSVVVMVMVMMDLEFLE